jgi:hypothetical protein
MALWATVVLTLPIAGTAAVLPAAQSTRDAPIRIGETFTPGMVFRVSVRVELAGNLMLPPEKGEAAGKPLTIRGQSGIDYDERILALDRTGKVEKSFRIYQRLDLERRVGNQTQQGALRTAVRRLVILRHKQIEVPFSPDGPLTWAEIDLVRTDVFTPALAGLFPDRPVRVGERWAAATSAVLELTDFEQLDGGAVACRLEQLATLNGRRLARISFNGSVTGLGEDGRSKQQLDGYFYFDLGTGHLSYLSMKGIHTLLDKDGKEVGRIEGNFILTRQPLRDAPALADAVVRKLTLEPNDNNTQLLYDDPDLGLRFFYPRRWRVAGGKGRQLGLDEQGGSGILLTVEPPNATPTGQQFLDESRQWLLKQKATIQRVEPVRLIQRSPAMENFALDVAVNGQQFRMYYLVIRQPQGGVVVAARLLPREIAALQQDVLRIGTSMQVTKKQ